MPFCGLAGSFFIGFLSCVIQSCCFALGVCCVGCFFVVLCVVLHCVVGEVCQVGGELYFLFLVEFMFSFSPVCFTLCYFVLSEAS